MKDEYDFSKAEQGKFFILLEEIQVPIYLDKDVFLYLTQKREFDSDKIRNLINDLLRRISK